MSKVIYQIRRGLGIVDGQHLDDRIIDLVQAHQWAVARAGEPEPPDSKPGRTVFIDRNNVAIRPPN